jgi:flagellar biogenesis protein FliO
MTAAGRPAAPYVPMARRVAAPRSVSARRIGAIACFAAIAAVALIGMLHPLSAAGGAQPSATADLAAATGVGSVWGIDDGGSGTNWIDLIAKGTIVLALLYITLRILGRTGAGSKKRGGRLEVLESRTLAAKASLHLIAIGDRRLVVGLTPSGMVSLAELDAAELETETAAADAAAETADSGTTQTPRPGLASALGSPLWPLDAIAGRIALLMNGGRVR